MKSYCVKQKKNTLSIPNSIKIVTAKNGRMMQKSICSECGAKKSRFVTAQKGEGVVYDMSMYTDTSDPTNSLYDKSQYGQGFDIHKAIMRVGPRNKTLPGHRFTGPGNPIEKQVKWDPNTDKILKIYQKPTGKTDAVSMQHDVDYTICKDDLKCKHKADKKMVKALDAIPWKDRQWGHTLARNMINTKQKVGMGVKQKKPKNVKRR